MTTNEDTPDPFTAMAAMFARQGWGDSTVLSIAATYSDEQGNFEVALIEEVGEPVFEPVRCNVNDPEAEVEEVLNHFIDFYRQWQAERYEMFGEWKTSNGTPS
jgi:hypothetical protein